MTGLLKKLIQLIVLAVLAAPSCIQSQDKFRNNEDDNKEENEVGLETGTYIDSLNSSNPVGASDNFSEGDDHLRLIKSTVKNTFPSITGAVNATQTELNFLASQEGALLNNGFANATGTVDAMIADFTPNISLTDGVIVVIMPVGQITILAPTFTPDGLTTKIIVKNNGDELDLTDIPSSGQTLILKYSSGLDKWVLLNPRNEGWLSDDFTLTPINLFDITSSVTASTWESVGPTGSGATNIWTALDTVPAGTKKITIMLELSISGSTNGGIYQGLVYARRGGSTLTTLSIATIAKTYIVNRSGSTETALSFTEITIPIDSSRIFDITWSSQGTTPSQISFMWLRGW